MDWSNLVPTEQWDIYREVICLARERGIPFALGGAFAMAAYTGNWRNTKDMDIYVEPEDMEAMKEVVHDCGLRDYYEKLPYDRGWIYRSYTGDCIIVDLICRMANRRSDVDRHWIHDGPQIDIRGERVRIIPAEEYLWAKLYVMQRDRCDWPDVLNVMYCMGHELDWHHLMRRLGPDLPLLGAVVSVFSWMCPARARSLPIIITADRIEHSGALDPDPERVRLLDSRPWFRGADLQKAA